MQDGPFMPKATAVWLVQNTTLSFKQIANFCKLHELEIKGIADGDVAKGIKKPRAVRAVANAIGKNPYAPKIPCHRVIRSDGTLGGYSGKGGIKTKKKLLKSEGIWL